MEIPSHLKELYRHWGEHISHGSAPLSVEEVCKDKKLWVEIHCFIAERMQIWMKKTSGAEAPFTADPIMATYRFCNIFREFDRQTIEFHTLLNPLRDNFPLWLLNMFYCRMVARTETVQSIGLLSFDQLENEALYERLSSLPRPRYGTPYVFPVSVILRSETPTRELFITKYLPEIMKSVAEEITGWSKLSVSEGVEKILLIFKYNLHFLWTEVLIDVAYQFPQYIDLFGTFPVGPGSLPTMKRINPNIEPTKLVAELAKTFVDTGLTYSGVPLRLSAENWEGIGCEFRKYTNLKAGKGRKRLYYLHG